MMIFVKSRLNIHKVAIGGAICGVLLIAGCDQSPSGKSADKTPPGKATGNSRLASSNQSPAPTDNTNEQKNDHDHGHKAPHGGLLIPLGDHFANIELVQDEKDKVLTAYIYDSCAENLVRLKQEKIEIKVVTVDGELMLSLLAIDNPLSGEKPGDSSVFQAEHANFASPIKSGAIVRVSVRGTDFENVAFAK